MAGNRAGRRPLRRVQCAQRRPAPLVPLRGKAGDGLRVGDGRAVRCDPLSVLRRIMPDAQKQVQDAIDRLVESGTERGLQVAVYRGADLVVDAVCGIADPATERPVTPATPFY